MTVMNKMILKGDIYSGDDTVYYDEILKQDSNTKKELKKLMLIVEADVKVLNEHKYTTLIFVNEDINMPYIEFKK
jgi:hypothetical protein